MTDAPATRPTPVLTGGTVSETENAPVVLGDSGL
jgi:hypothetical protein